MELVDINADKPLFIRYFLKNMFILCIKSDIFFRLYF